MKYPLKLKAGDTIRVVSLSGPIEWAKPDKLKKAEQFFAARDINVTYAEHMNGEGPLNVVPVEQRIREFDKAIADPKIQAVWSLSGGENANQIIPQLDTKLFKKMNKLFVGHSDISVLLNALTTASGVATYYGPNFHALGSSHGVRTTYDFVDKAVFSDTAYDLAQVKTWHDKDYTVSPPQSRTHRDKHGWWPIRSANGTGGLIASEISTIALLQGTEYFPNLKGKVLALEMYQGSLDLFDRLLESILLQKGADKLEGLIIGRFVSTANIDRNSLTELLLSKEQIQGIPIIANVDFGHTVPRITMPIGGHVQLQVADSKQRIRIGEH